MSTKKWKLKPILDDRTTKLLNLKVLQRLDPCVQKILTTAPQVVIYQFNPETIEWTRKNVQGSLFVVKRSTQPLFQFIVMNRLHTENMVENLLGTFECEVHGPYLLYKNHSQEINGIWFYNENECEEIANLFSRLCNEYTEVPTDSTRSPIKKLSFDVEKDTSLEPSSSGTSKAADVVDDPPLSNTSSPSQSSTALVPASFQSISLETLLSSAAPASSPSTPVSSIPENKPEAAKKCSTDLVKPSSLLSPYPFPQIKLPITSRIPTLPPLISPANLKRPYGALLLQPYPPPTSPHILPPIFLPTPPYLPVTSREKVRKALQSLVQDDQFIDIVYRAVMDAPEG